MPLSFVTGSWSVQRITNRPASQSANGPIAESNVHRDTLDAGSDLEAELGPRLVSEADAEAVVSGPVEKAPIAGVLIDLSRVVGDGCLDAGVKAPSVLERGQDRVATIEAIEGEAPGGGRASQAGVEVKRKR